MNQDIFGQKEDIYCCFVFEMSMCAKKYPLFVQKLQTKGLLYCYEYTFSAVKSYVVSSVFAFEKLGITVVPSGYCLCVVQEEFGTF